MMQKYNHKAIESKWQKEWEKQKLYEAQEDSGKKKCYLLVEFPYPSGAGLHVGHVRSYTAMDVVARKRRAQGESILYPIGWDAFGLPTENYAIKTGTPPKIVTKENTDTFRRQLQSLGFSFDWSREINTTDPSYYKWTQWIFLLLFEKGLAYKAKRPINWCISCKIGLADEEVVGGMCERCNGPTEKREKEQWMLAITKYADRLDKDLDDVDYLPKIKIQQRNWIGRSEGAIITFPISNFQFPNSHKESPVKECIEIFTTRPDTLFGATYVVLAPEHPSVQTLLEHINNKEETIRYIVQSRGRTDIERTAEGKQKTGIELKGVTAINPATKEAIPIWIADYVLGHYGTGAIMGVPAHDERDCAFAKKFGLPVRQVIEPLFISTKGEDAVRSDLPFVERDAVVAIIKHWSEDIFLCLRWKKTPWRGFVTGGVEHGEDCIEAARREIIEETGYTDARYVQEFGVMHSQFFHPLKKENRFAHFRTVYFELQSPARQDIGEEEKEIHDVAWLPREEVRDFLEAGDVRSRWDRFLGVSGAYTGSGLLSDSGKFTGMDSQEAKKVITEFVGGEMKTTYKLRDWVFSRQRYWGEPIPLVFCEECKKRVEEIKNQKSKIKNGEQEGKEVFSKGELLNPGWIPVPEHDLPVTLPEVGTYAPTDTGESPLAAMTDWVKTTCPRCGGAARRETDTMPNWAGSSWYYLRYIDPSNENEFVGKEKLAYWSGSSETLQTTNYKLQTGPVDWYNGGMEHTTLHLLYSRFWHKFLYDEGLVPTSEPYMKRTSHGLILAEGGEKMSKSKGNVVNPDDIVERLGADTLRLYEMFMGPFDQAVGWSGDGVIGPRRFLERVWNLQKKVAGDAIREKDADHAGALHGAIKKVSDDIESMSFNTAVSTLMILSNTLAAQEKISRNVYAVFLRLLAPFAPHITEELWALLGHTTSIHQAPWPFYDESKTHTRVHAVTVQVDGKVRGSFSYEGDTLSNEEVQARAAALPGTVQWLAGKEVGRVIHAKGKLINFVLRSER